MLNLSVNQQQPVQYSDLLTFTVSVTDPDNEASTLTFSAVDLPNKLIITDNINGTATVIGLILEGSGSYTTVITVTDPGGLSDTAIVSILVSQEDARATYTGPVLVSTGCADCSTATVPLRATIQDITAVAGDPAYDPDPGDITNATVTFVNRDNGNAPLCSASVVLLDSADPTVGTATCDWVANIGNNSGVDYTIGMLVDGYYTRDSTEDNTVVTLSKPTRNFIIFLPMVKQE